MSMKLNRLVESEDGAASSVSARRAKTKMCGASNERTSQINLPPEELCMHILANYDIHEDFYAIGGAFSRFEWLELRDRSKSRRLTVADLKRDMKLGKPLQDFGRFMPRVPVAKLSLARNHVALLTEVGCVHIMFLPTLPWHEALDRRWWLLPVCSHVKFTNICLVSCRSPVDILDFLNVQQPAFPPPKHVPRSTNCCGTDFKWEDCSCCCAEQDITLQFILGAVDANGNLWMGSNADCCCSRIVISQQDSQYSKYCNRKHLTERMTQSPKCSYGKHCAIDSRSKRCVANQDIIGRGRCYCHIIFDCDDESSASVSTSVVGLKRRTTTSRVWQLHCPMKREDVRCRTHRGSRATANATCTYICLPDAEDPCLQPRDADPPGALACGGASGDELGPTFHYATICRSRTLPDKYSLFVKGRRGVGLEGPLSQMPLKVLCGRGADVGVVLLTDGQLLIWLLPKKRSEPADVSATSSLIISPVRGSLDKRRVLDVCSGFEDRTNPKVLEFFALCEDHIVHEFCIPPPSENSFPHLRTRPPIPEPIEVTPFCFDLLYSHPKANIRIPFKVENFAVLLQTLPASYRQTFLNDKVVSVEAATWFFTQSDVTRSRVSPGNKSAVEAVAAEYNCDAPLSAGSECSLQADATSSGRSDDQRDSPARGSLNERCKPNAVDACLANFCRLRSLEIAYLYGFRGRREYSRLLYMNEANRKEADALITPPVARRLDNRMERQIEGREQFNVSGELLSNGQIDHILCCGLFLVGVQSGGGLMFIPKSHASAKILVPLGGCLPRSPSVGSTSVSRDPFDFNIHHVREVARMHEETKLRHFIADNVTNFAVSCLSEDGSLRAPRFPHRRELSPVAVKLLELSCASDNQCSFRLFSGPGYIIVSRLSVKALRCVESYDVPNRKATSAEPKEYASYSNRTCLSSNVDILLGQVPGQPRAFNQCLYQSGG